MIFIRKIFIFALICLSPFAVASRLALVIGNNNYQGQFARLANPINDATKITTALEKVGFQVTFLRNLNEKAFNQAIQDFSTRLEKDDIAFVYYAGHSVAVTRKDGGGDDYLIPIGTEVDIAANLKYNAINAQEMLNSITASGAHTVLVLDACRNNPFARGSSRGLRFMENVGSSYIFYSASYGEEAQDDGTFASALAAEIVRPQSLDALRVRVSKAVIQATGGRQRPTAKNDLFTHDGTLYFLKQEEQIPQPTEQTPQNLTTEQAVIEGINAYDRGDYSVALSFFQQAAEANHAKAQLYLGFMYEAEEGISKDEVKAKYWYEKAAKQDVVEAQLRLGAIYGLEENFQQSKYWFNKAAAQGNKRAQKVLEMYRSAGL